MMSSRQNSNTTSLRQRVFNAAKWSLGGYGLSQIIRFGSNLLLTRMLVPDMFGIMALAYIVTVGLGMFSDLGLRPNIVQSKRGDDATFLNTAWAVQIVRGFILCGAGVVIALLVFVAGWIEVIPASSAYADPRLPIVIAVLSCGFIIGGFNSTKLFEASRRLELSRITLIELAVQIAGLVVIFGWAYFDPSVWAMVASSLCSSLVLMALSHTCLNGTANRWRWDESALQEIVHFGKWILLGSIIAFFVSNGDRLLLGGVVDATVLGIYTIAFGLVSAVEAVLTRLIGGVTFPALSQIARERPEALQSTYYRLHLILAPPIYFCSGALMIFGGPLIGLLYDPRYAEAGWMLEVLAVGLLGVPFQIAIQCFIALGMPRLNSNILAVRLAALVVAMPIGFQVSGIQGALWGLVLSQLSYLPMIVFYSYRYGIFDLRRELLAVPAVFAGMAFGAALTFAVRSFS